MAPPSIVRQVDALEADVCVTLLSRSTSAFAPTAAGALLLRRGQAALNDFMDIWAEVTALNGVIGGAPHIAPARRHFGKRDVIPALDALLLEHPDLRIGLHLTERMADPVADQLDALIRLCQRP